VLLWSIDNEDNEVSIMKTTAEKINRAPAEAFRVASEGGIVTIAHGQYPKIRFELTARPAKNTIDSCTTEITRIVEKALSSVELSMSMSGLSCGIYAGYAAKVAAEVFRQVMHITSSDMGGPEIFKIASEIECGI
jgi:hypothetical protein